MKKLFLFLFMALFATSTFAQEDAENCKDHPFFNRLPNFFIEVCSDNFNQFDFVTGVNKTESKEGNLTSLTYVFGSETAKLPSELQIIRNYEAAILKNGGKRIFIGSEDGTPNHLSHGTFTMAKDGKQYWVSIHGFYTPAGNGISKFELAVMEMEPMKQEIEAKEMFDQLSTKGSVALYINFETAKAIIKPESDKIIEQVAQMLKDNPTVRISVEGHTQAEKAGAESANKILSEQRAKAVMTSLVSKGIAANRMTSKGWGQEKPIGDNNTEDGRAMNRRVEIVKL